MTISHPVSTRNAVADTVVDKVDQGSANAQGQLNIMASDDTVLAELPMSNPAFGSASNGTATANSITSDTDATATGTAAKFELVDRDGTTVVEGSVGTTGSGEDIELDNTSITAGDTVSITSLTYTAPA